MQNITKEQYEKLKKKITDIFGNFPIIFQDTEIQLGNYAVTVTLQDDYTGVSVKNLFNLRVCHLHATSNNEEQYFTDLIIVDPYEIKDIRYLEAHFNELHKKAVEFLQYHKDRIESAQRIENKLIEIL